MHSILHSHRHLTFTLTGLFLMAVLLLTGWTTNAADRRASDIRSTKHNLSSTGGQDVRARSESAGGTDEICVFCHTPHGASTNPGQPLWNRADSTGDTATYNPDGYNMYDSSTLNASASIASAPTEQSKLCLSCHDGTLAIGAVGNAPGSGSGTAVTESGFDDIKIRMEHAPSATGVGSMAQVPNLSGGGIDSASGFTRNLGVDLSNDHPISFPYTTALANADGELRDPSHADNDHIATRVAGTGTRPIYPLTGDNMQCTTCHDPHVKGQDLPTGTTGNGNSKFLRGPRFQMSVPSGVNFQQGVFDPDTGNADPFTGGDIICLACHNRELGASVWADSAHADPDIADEQYRNTGTPLSPSELREFPTNIKVWQASCLNCHDTHSVAGSRRLLREGIDGGLNPDGAKSGGTHAVEETCYQCHSDNAGTDATILVLPDGTGSNGVNYADEMVPDIKSEFARINHMPIATGEQRNASTRPGGTGEEVHDIIDADFIETKENLGKGSLLTNRHAECTDCHNPHRVQRNSRFNDDGVDDGLDDFADGIKRLRTHVTGLNETSTTDNDGREGNVASGVLRGAWGVDMADPADIVTRVSSLNDFTWPLVMNANDFEVRSGDPGNLSVTQADNAKHMTREYQLCFKCHSSFSQDYRTAADRGRSQTDITLAGQGGTTASGTNQLTYYTNVASEFLSVNATNPPTTTTDQGEVYQLGSGADNDTKEDPDTRGNLQGDACIDGTPLGNCEPTSVNHRSWHPVVFPTGRDRKERAMGASPAPVNLRPPFDDHVGTQTMQCSDCHGANGSYTAGVGENRSAVQGPHGSDTKFLLKTGAADPWDPGLPETAGVTRLGGNFGLCGNCHDPFAQGTNDGPATSGPGAVVDASGFYGDHEPDVNMGIEACMNCHIAVPHGWKNKAFLVNLNCVGKEANESFGSCQAVGDWRTAYTSEPYYVQSFLQVATWAASGSWQYSSCEGDAMKDCAK